MLELYHPAVAGVDCGDCRRYLHDSEWQVVRRPARVGLPVLRPPGTPTPCHGCPKIPDDAPKHWDHAVTLTAKNRQAWRHYQECRAVGEWPKDWIVRRNARLIRSVMDQYDQDYIVRSFARLFAKR